MILQLLDETFCEFEQWARGRGVESVLYEERNTLSADQRKKLSAEVTRMRGLLEEVRDALGLEKQVQTAGQAIWSRCLTLSEQLSELDAKHLRRYGKPPSALMEYLDPKVAEMLEGVKRVSSMVRGGKE